MKSPTRRGALVVCVALLLVTAGCSSVIPADTTTTNPTSTTATTSWSPNASVGQYPPGVADNGTLTNVSALLNAHGDATANESLAFTYEWTTPDESGERRYVRGESQTPYYSTYNRTTDGEQSTEEFYRPDDRGYSRLTFDNETAYRVLQNSTLGVRAMTDNDVFGPRESLWLALSKGAYSVNGTVERNGRTFVQLSADEPSTWGEESVSAYEGTVLVTPAGVVYDVEASFENTDGNHVEESITLDTDVAWPGPPAWVGELPQLSLSVVEDGHAIKIENTGGTALPADTTLEVYGTDEKPKYGNPAPDASGTITTDVRLEPGEAVYVTAGPNGEAFVLHDELVRGEYSFGYAAAYAESDGTIYRLSNLPDPRLLRRPR